jgi:putative FmdB family regulatory protein
MPLYDSRCPECEHQQQEYRPVAQHGVQPTCERCGALMVPDLVAQVQGTAVRGDYKHPIRMESMGFIADPEDVAEHRRRFPNVELVMEDGHAIPRMRSLGQKRAYLKAMGWVDKRSFC